MTLNTFRLVSAHFALPDAYSDLAGKAGPPEETWPNASPTNAATPRDQRCHHKIAC